MTNEELAVEIQAGKAEYGELWERVHRFVRQQANRYFSLYGGLCAGAGVELDDLIQCGFLALRDAVKALEPARGYTLLAYLKYPLLNHFRQVCGIRTVRRDPLNSCDSLDRPVGEEDGTSLGDFLPDIGASDAMENVEERVYSQELHNALSAALDTLEEKQRDTLHRRYWNCDTLDAIAKDYGVPRERVRKMEAKALYVLRYGKCRKQLIQFVQEIRSEFAYHGTGLTTWKNTGASSVERTAEKLDEIEKRAGL